MVHCPESSSFFTNPTKLSFHKSAHQNNEKTRTREKRPKKPLFIFSVPMLTAPLLLVLEGELPDPLAVPLPEAVEDGTGSVLVSTADVEDGVTVAVPTSTVRYMPATGPSRPVLLT